MSGSGIEIGGLEINSDVVMVFVCGRVASLGPNKSNLALGHRKWDSPWQGVEENQAVMTVMGMIQQPMEIMLIVRERCCEKKIVDLFGAGRLPDVAEPVVSSDG